MARKIHQHLVDAWPDGLTDDELSCLLHDVPMGSVSKRRLDLWRAGRVQEHGITRPTRWGRQATVWFAAFPEDPL